MADQVNQQTRIQSMLHVNVTYVSLYSSNGGFYLLVTSFLNATLPRKIIFV